MKYIGYSELTEQWLDGFVEFDAVKFTNGYLHNVPTITMKYEGIDFGFGKEEWGAEPGKEYFVIKLGNSIQQHKQ